MSRVEEWKLNVMSELHDLGGQSPVQIVTVSTSPGPILGRALLYGPRSVRAPLPCHHSLARIDYSTHRQLPAVVMPAMYLPLLPTRSSKRSASGGLTWAL